MRGRLGQTIELKHRLPDLWRGIHTGHLEPWRGRRIADATMGLSQEAAEDRHFTFHHHQIGSTGTTRMDAEMDLADAQDLDAAIAAEAEALRLAGCLESLDVRRTLAAGRIGRLHLGRDDAATGQEVAERGRRQVTLHVHLSEAALTAHPGRDTLAQVQRHQRTVTVEQVRTWCMRPDATIVVKPVLDTDAHIGVAAYEVPDRLAEQSETRDGTCVHPWCGRSAVRCDKDHVVAHADGGPTCGCNIAPLCRRHHRLKTHSPWSYTVIEPGTYLWTSPHGYQFLRDKDGTTDVTRRHGRPPLPPRPRTPAESPAASPG